MLNIDRIQLIANALEELNEKVVFVGGSVVQLYVDDPSLTDVRPTMDVDCISHLDSFLDFYGFEEMLRKKGFINDQTPGAPICRWKYQDETVDIMPDNEKILGFGNPWYKRAISSKRKVKLPNGKEIYILDDPYFLATKIEALKGRGGLDWRLSHDFEDIVYLLNYTTELESKIIDADPELKNFITTEFKVIGQHNNIKEEILCALSSWDMEDATIILDKIRRITQL